jgi:predicted amidophosphoribosyltransferase
MSNDYLRLPTAPSLTFQNPLCDACSVEVDNDDDGWLCPSCGTTWDGQHTEGNPGELYADWSGEQPEGPDATLEDAWLVRMRRP